MERWEIERNEKKIDKKNVQRTDQCLVEVLDNCSKSRYSGYMYPMTRQVRVFIVRGSQAGSAVHRRTKTTPQRWRRGL